MSNIPFRVVRGEEITILNMPFNEGYVYFAIDTKRIYMDTYLNGEEQNKISMGGNGNSGIYYASKGFKDSSDVSFSLDDLEGDDLPNKNDLIINYNSSNELRDGFYKVIESNVVTNTVETQYLPVGGGGGGSGSNSGGKIIIKPITPATGMTTLEKGYIIEYSLEAYNNGGAPITTSGKATYIINGISIDGGAVNHGGIYSFPITQYLDTTKETNTITLKVTLNTGGIVDDVQTYTWTVRCINLQLVWDWTYSSKNYIKEDTFTLNWKVKGGIDCVTHITVDDKDEEGKYYFVQPVKNSESDVSKTFDRTQLLDTFSYGAHKITMQLSANVGNEIIYSEPVSHMLTFIGGDNTNPILTVPYFNETATQYDTLRIPFLVYQPNVEKLEVSFSVDNNQVLENSYSTTAEEPHVLPYTLGLSGEVKLKLMLVSDPDVYREIVLQVSPLDLGITEPDGEAFSLKASEISSNVQLLELQEQGKISFSSNFDWINGGLQFESDEDGNISNYICVRQGTTMTLNYPLFASSQVGIQGKTFKFCFKAVNCYDYNAPVLSCYDPNTSNLYLEFNAQEARFASAASTDFTTQYCEGSYIELETEIWPNQLDSGNRPGDRFLMFWIDGVPAGVKTYEYGTNFVQNTPSMITIGSDECDVYVYIAKIYEKKLSRQEHLNNFILDAPNAKEISSRFNRNNILTNGEISYEKLVKNNPGCHAYLYKLTENGMTTGKKDEKDCDYIEYYMNAEKPYITANNAKVMVQGTSSAAYGVAAYNLRTDFGDTTMYNENGEEIKGRKVSESSIPVDFTCTKVNVASCENANNALNQEWYNKYQPYHDAHRRKSTKTEQYRDCMEFDFGVVFVEDHNKTKEFLDVNGKPDQTLYTSANVFAYNTDGEKDDTYINNPYYKQYAVGNMGNDKKNREVFHDTKNYNTCCVEVLDNQNKKHWMTETADIEDFVWDDNDTGFYEFRYSVDKYKGSEALPSDMTKSEYEKVQAQAFIDFVNWMASCDPNPYSEDHPNGYKENQKLPDNVKKDFEPYTFKGFSPPGYENQDNPTGISIKGLTISDYATTTPIYKQYSEPINSIDEFTNALTAIKEELNDSNIVFCYQDSKYETKKDEAGNEYQEKIYLGTYTETNNYIETEQIYYYKYVRGSYTHDTYDYRMAKLLDECEEHLVMDSVIYHYLFIQRHTMVDNVAKNTFWSTEDLKHWDLTKNYDNDTSDGNDNSGYLKYGYGKEVMDPGVFNAEQSVWLNFIHALPQAQEYLYKQLQNRKINGASVWDADAYLKLFKEKQSLIPEYCWIEDYFRKYIRPRRLGLDGEDKFIQRLEGGKKTHQRKQYETYQSYYIDSKYCSGGAFNDTGSFDMRLNKSGKENFPWTGNENFPVSYYIDLYPSAKIGGQIWRGTRTKRGQENVNIPIGQIIDSPNDATCYIYAATMLQKIGGIADTYPNYLGLSAASKLREIEVGSDREGYFNPKLKNAILNSNTQLEKAQLQQVGMNGMSGLDLSKLVMLKELKLDKGSWFPTLKLAEGCIIDTLYLNEHLTSLNVKELTKLTTQGFKYDINIFNNLTTVLIKDCPALNEFSYELAKRNKISNYCFNNIEWTINANSIEDFDIATGIIPVLENLRADNKGYVEVSNKTLALTGTLKINLNNLSQNTKINEFLVYNEYKADFPNLNIIFEGDLNYLIPAKTIRFYSDYDKNNKLPIGEIIYEVKTDGTHDLNWLTSAAGPVGIAMGTPKKESDNRYNYNWSGKWREKNQDIEFTSDDMSIISPAISTDYGAIHEASDRLYKVVLRDWNGIDLKTIENIKYEDNIEDNIPYYEYRPHNIEGMRYEFQGWITAKDYLSGSSNISVVTDFTILNDITYYAFYKEQDCISTPSRMDYFNFPGDGKKIDLLDKYFDLIQEPITLPLKNKKGEFITSVGNLGAYGRDGINKIPIVYFENNGVGGSYKTIENRAFCAIKSGNGVDVNNSNCQMFLKAIYLPNTIINIEEAAFTGCLYLETIQLPDTNQDNVGILSIETNAFSYTGKIQIPESITNNIQPLKKLNNLGVAAFYEAGNGVYLSKIPDNLKYIKGWAFAYCNNVYPQDFSKVTQINESAFNNSGNLYETNMHIILPNDISNYQKNCFINYAKNKIANVTYAGGGIVEDTVLADLGITLSNPVTIEQIIE